MTKQETITTTGGPFNEDLDMIRDQLRRFIQTEVTAKADAWEEEGMVPRDVLRRMGDLGVLGMRYDEKYGGAGLDVMSSVVLAEEVGRRLANPEQPLAHGFLIRRHGLYTWGRDLDEAKRLREEAQEIYASYERRQREVSGQADQIIANAKREAEAQAAKAKEDLKISIERRLKAAEEQIASAESDAVRAVRDRAVRTAAAAMTNRNNGNTGRRWRILCDEPVKNQSA